jgi:N-acetylmuramic acid 6-phosphate etherase
MKPGSAQKMALNMLSTGAMARLGYVYGNLMVNVQILNRKLVERGLAILERAAGVDRQSAAKTLKAADNQVAVALIMLKTGLDRKQARQRLKSVKGNVRQAVAMG